MKKNQEFYHEKLDIVRINSISKDGKTAHVYSITHKRQASVSVDTLLDKTKKPEIKKYVNNNLLFNKEQAHTFIDRLTKNLESINDSNLSADDLRTFIDLNKKICTDNIEDM